MALLHDWSKLWRGSPLAQKTKTHGNDTKIDVGGCGDIFDVIRYNP